LKIERRDYIKNESKLYGVFEKWLHELYLNPSFGYYRAQVYNYNKAIEMIKNIKPTIDEAHSALIFHEDHPRIKYAGLFLSAVYNLVEDKTIVFDVNLDVDINYLGYRLEKGKILVNRSKVGDWMGEGASGTVINYGKAGDDMGSFASGTVISYGKAGDWTGEGASGIVVNYGEAGDWTGSRASGIVVNYGEAGRLMGFRSSGTVINYGKAGDDMGFMSSGKIIAIKNPKSFGDLKYVKLVLREEECRIIPGLIEYFDELKNKIYEVRNNPELLLKIFGDNPADKIKKDVDNVLYPLSIYFHILYNIL
jgi:formylmethanofuran dehydrogenase subunit C